jgi:hypothetical protein
MREFNFIINTPPDETTIDEFHKSLARILVKKYGVETIKKVIQLVEQQKQ